MKKFLFFAFTVAIFTANAVAQYTYSNDNNSAKSNLFRTKTPVLIELFTSESCFACPPAEMALAKIKNEQPFENAEAITLEFHVDYRDGFGRKDILASALFTQRQKIYDRKFRTGKIYTPQMVVDGDIEFIGSNLKKAEKAVSKTLKNSKSDIKLSFEENRLKINISNLPKHDFATVYMAITEDGLITRNRKKLDEANVSVVRQLIGLSRILPTDEKFEMNANFYIDKSWKKENISFVVFLQENVSRNIFGVAKIKAETTNADRKL